MHNYSFKNLWNSFEHPNGDSYFCEENFPLQLDRQIGWWNKPNFAWQKSTIYQSKTQNEILKFNVFSDRYGFRCSEQTYKRQEILSYKIIFAGESNIWGQGLNYEDTLTSLVEKKFGEKIGNASLIAMSGVQCFLILNRIINEGIRPEKFIYFMLEENLIANIVKCCSICAPFCFERPYIGIKNGIMSIKFIKDPQENLKNYLDWYRRNKKSYYKLFFISAIHRMRKKIWRKSRLMGSCLDGVKHQKLQDEMLRALMFLMKTFKLLCNSYNIDFHVVYYPVPNQQSNIQTQQKIVNILQESGVSFLNFHKILTPDICKDSNFVFKLDGHLNKEGHKIFANEILKSNILH